MPRGGDVAEFAAGARGFAIEVEVGVGNGEDFSGIGRSPMRLSMAQWPAGPVEPSGRPRTARRWFSNWLVTAPSMVQWPEIVKRGANSLARSSPRCSKKFDGEDADVFEGFENAMGSTFRGALNGGFERGRAQQTGGGCRCDGDFPRAVDGGFSVAGAHCENGEFAGERTKRSRMSVTRGNSSLALATSCGVRRIHWPLPS